MQNHRNIILILVDSLRADAVSCYNKEVQTTPQLDMFATDAVVFENFFSNSSWTLASVSSLFTGKLVSHHNTCDHNQRLAGTHITLASELSKRGYDTVAFSDNSYVSVLTGLDKGFVQFNELRFEQLNTANKLRKVIKQIPRCFKRFRWKKGKYCDTAIQFNEMQRWIARRPQGKSPFFMYAHFDQVHYPYTPALKYVKNDESPAINKRDYLNLTQDRERIVAGKTTLNPFDFRLLRNLYHAELSYLDSCLGRFFDFLRALKLWDNTILIVTSDHGDNFGEHGLFGHGLCLYDTILKVPLILRFPTRFGGNRIDTFAQLSNLFATILDLADECFPPLQVNRPPYERSLVPFMMGRSSPQDEFVIAEHGLQNISMFEKAAAALDKALYLDFHRTLYAIRDRQYKFIWSSNGKHELYDLLNDPGETNNLIDANSVIAEKMSELLFRHAKPFQQGEQLDTNADKEVLRRLADLGYV